MQHASRVISLLALCIGVGGARIKSHSQEARMSSISTQDAKLAVPLEPFDVILTVTNKQEVMEKQFGSWFGWAASTGISDHAFADKLAGKLIDLLPPALKEKGMTVSVSKKSIQGLTVRLTLQITDFDLSKIQGVEFTDHLKALGDILGNLGKSDQYKKVEQMSSEKVRAGLMGKLPDILKEKLAKESVKIETPTTDPAPPTFPLPDQALAPNHKLFYRVKISDRTKVAEMAGGRLKSNIVLALPGEAFLKIVREKVEQRVPQSLEQKLGGSLKVEAITQPDENAGSDYAKGDSFGLIIQVDDIDLVKLITVQKGAFEASEFTKMLDEMKYLHLHGVESMQITMENIRTGVWKQAIEGLDKQLPEQLRTLLDADVQEMSEKQYTDLQGKAEIGRCCSPAREGEGKMFFVKEDTLGGGGMFGFGLLGRSGHCPTIDVENHCKQMGGTKTHFRSIMDCFEIRGDELRQTADPIDAHCTTTGQRTKIEVPTTDSLESTEELSDAAFESHFAFDDAEEPLDTQI